MTTTPELTEIEVPLKDLVLHELNARAGSPETYEADDIPVLAASIATLGLLNPLIVQKTGKVWGVIAGGRRHAALMHLVNDKGAKGWVMRTKVKCRALPDDTAAATAITVAENVTQKAMDPIDEFEAFARMMEAGGHGPDSIARMFGVERRRVVDRLRFGRVHPEIRAAVRARTMAIDTMKAFADHPDQEVQKTVFDALKAENCYVSGHVIRSRLKDRGVKIGDPVGQLVLSGYRAAGGDVAADLIEEDSILTDQELVDRLLMETLDARAEAERARLGFAWAEAARTVDYEALRSYGRIYPSEIEPQDEAKTRAMEIADRLAEIEELRETDETADIDALEDEWERLNNEYEELTTGYAAEDLARSGVIAAWERGEVTLLTGLVRPEDKLTARPSTPAPAAAGGEATGAGDETGAGPLALSESLRTDLKTEQAMVVGSALAADPALAQDLVLFKITADILGSFSRVSYALGISASTAERPHGKLEGVDARPAEALETLYANLDLSWWDEKSPRKLSVQFDAFRKLDAEMKARIVAVVVAHSVKPTGYGRSEELLGHVARQVVPDLRAVWRPTGEAFFGRLKKNDLLGILAGDLKQPEEAARLAAGKKGEIVDFLERLFAAPFATLTPEQREAVETWCPPAMEIRPALDTIDDGADEFDPEADVPMGDDEEEIDLSDTDTAETELA